MYNFQIRFEIFSVEKKFESAKNGKFLKLSLSKFDFHTKNLNHVKEDYYLGKKKKGTKVFG